MEVLDDIRSMLRDNIFDDFFIEYEAEHIDFIMKEKIDVYNPDHVKLFELNFNMTIRECFTKRYYFMDNDGAIFDDWGWDEDY